MMKPCAFLASMLVLFSPLSAHADPRIQTVDYQPDKIIRIVGVRSIQTMVTLGDDEHIENIALGDASAWQVTPNRRGNLLFVRPLRAITHTNMAVITDRRRYLFDLVGGADRAKVKFSIQFVYPEPIALNSTREPPVLIPPPAPPPPVPINTQWQARGDKAMIPARIYDDGTSTYIAWTNAGDIPAVLVLGSDGVEGPVNFTARGDYLVVDGVARRYVLRRGKESAVLVNTAAVPEARVPQVLPPVGSGDAP